MTDPTDIPAPKPSYVDSEGAPFIYFDVAPTYGVLNGAVQVELAARTIAPGEGGTTSRFIATGHLRCSPGAAHDLVEALKKALEMLEQPQQQPPAGSALN